MRIQLSDHFNSRRLFLFALPSILMMIFTSIYSVVDGIFVSNFAGADAFAGVNLVFPFLMILTSLGFVVGTGGSALVGKLLGEGDPDQANRVFSMLVYFDIIVGVILTVLGLIFLEPIVKLLGATENLLPYCIRYGRIMILAMPFAILEFSFQLFFVTAEKPNLSLISTLISGVSNMILDAILVGYFKLNVEGAATATVICQVMAGAFPLVYFGRKNNSLLKLGKPEISLKPLVKTLTNGFSEFLSNITMNLVAVLFNYQLLRYIGEAGVSAYGVLMYVDLVFVAVYIGYSNGVAPIVSYHYGAKNNAEMRNIFKKSLRILLVFAVCMLLFSQLAAEPLCSIFVGYDKDLKDLTVHAFRIYSFMFPLASLSIFGSSFFTALNDGLTSAIISFLRTAVFEIAAILTFPILFGIDGIWYSVVATEIVSSILTVCFFYFKRSRFGFVKENEDLK